jgi:hypothetical protein
VHLCDEKRTTTGHARLAALALLSGLLPAGASLGLTAPPAAAAVTGPGTGARDASAAAEDFQQVTLRELP